MAKALKSNKGNGYAARLIDLCDVAELPASITRFLDRVYADFPRPEPAPLPPSKARRRKRRTSRRASSAASGSSGRRVVTIVICEKRQRILDAMGHLLLLGGPSSGKTTIALKKAVRLIDEGLQVGQAILFLSFSRAAVARIGEASKAEVQKAKRHQLSIQTFHSFYWELLRSHGYLVGCPKERILHIQEVLELEPKAEENLRSDIAKCLEMLAAVRRVGGSKAAIQDAARYLKWAHEVA